MSFFCLSFQIAAAVSSLSDSEDGDSPEQYHAVVNTVAAMGKGVLY